MFLNHVINCYAYVDTTYDNTSVLGPYAIL